MTISEVIEVLRYAMDVFGDLPVCYEVEDEEYHVEKVRPRAYQEWDDTKGTYIEPARVTISGHYNKIRRLK